MSEAMVVRIVSPGIDSAVGAPGRFLPLKRTGKSLAQSSKNLYRLIIAQGCGRSVFRPWNKGVLGKDSLDLGVAHLGFVDKKGRNGNFS